MIDRGFSIAMFDYRRESIKHLIGYDWTRKIYIQIGACHPTSAGI